MTKFAIPPLLRSSLAAGALLSLGGCMYGGAGYYGDGYVNNSRYDCDPYAPFDDYYACDYGYGFANIGFGGGWYDQYYYPGYGVYVFDRGGRRHAMRDRDRRYWAGQRAAYGGRHARDRTYHRGQRADRRDWRNDRRDDSRDSRRGSYRNNGYRDDARTRDGAGTRADRRAARRDAAGQAAPVRNRGDWANQPNRRPTRAVAQPQARPQPVARPAPSVQARPEGPRQSPRTSRSTRERISDD
tara:strand:+ start:1126 stop:1851 length:726 start_codon:yes stop_codon:yes gene_type:complete